METKDTPVIRDLERFAETLPEQARAEVYRIAISFLEIGASHGAQSAMMCLAGGKSSAGDEQKQYIAYLSAKAQEYS